MKAIIEKKIPYGTIDAPTSKSIAHRLLINAALCDEPVEIKRLPLNKDILATIDCLRGLGCGIELDGDRCVVKPTHTHSKVLSETSISENVKNKTDVNKTQLLDNFNKRVLNANESGSTLRFLIPIALLDDIETTFICSKRLLERPLDVYEQIARANNFKWEKTAESLTVKGHLKPGTYEVPGNISSQYITGLMFALSTFDEESRVVITTDIESKSYIDLSMDCMRQFGADVLWDGKEIVLHPGKCQAPANLIVEGDHSGAAFFGAMNVLDGKITINGLNDSSIQGDRVWQEYFKLFGPEKNPEISIKDCPDLGPVLMALGAASGGCRLLDTARLKIKESDRANVMALELKKFGIAVDVLDNEVIVHKGTLKKPNQTLCGHNDHRIVMSLAVLLMLTGGEIDGCEAVNKSMPEFFDLLKQLHVDCKLYN